MGCMFVDIFAGIIAFALAGGVIAICIKMYRDDGNYKKDQDV